MCESVGWWCSNLNTYGKSLSFPLVHFFSGCEGVKGKMNFPNVLFYMRNLTFFPSTLTAFASLALPCSPTRCGCSDGMMIVILVSFTTGRIVVTMINVETEIIDTLKVFFFSYSGMSARVCPPSPRRYGKFHRWPILITLRIMLIPTVLAFRTFLFIVKTMPWQRRWSEGGRRGEEDDDFILIKI